MSKVKWLDELIKEIPLGGSEQKKIREAYESEISRPPKIALIGPAGVGKSSTINALFGTSLRVSHTKAGTLSATRIPIIDRSVRVKGAKGILEIYDMPGIDEDVEKDKDYKEVYRNIISQCDVAVWVLSAVDRRFAYDQLIIRDILRIANEGLVSRLVFGVNKVDLIYPGDWNFDANLPSRVQEHNLHERLEDIKDKLIRVCPGLTEDRIVGYSATQRYNLLELFGAMLNACPDDRAWVLGTRKKIADYWELVNPKLRKNVQLVSARVR